MTVVEHYRADAFSTLRKCKIKRPKDAISLQPNYIISSASDSHGFTTVVIFAHGFLSCNPWINNFNFIKYSFNNIRFIDYIYRIQCKVYLNYKHLKSVRKLSKVKFDARRHFIHLQALPKNLKKKWQMIHFHFCWIHLCHFFCIIEHSLLKSYREKLWVL